MYGAVDQSHFGDEYLQNQSLLDLTGRVNVSVSEEANQLAPEAMLCDVEAVTGSGQGMAQGADNQATDKGGIAEADLGLGRMDIDVDLVGRQLDIQRHDRMTVTGEEVLIGPAHGTAEQRVGRNAIMLAGDIPQCLVDT